MTGLGGAFVALGRIGVRVNFGCFVLGLRRREDEKTDGPEGPVARRPLLKTVFLQNLNSEGAYRP